tara:strand:+ start:377 stop:1138 length:762 start_codon:yes stop_codon:yes gene_type:complete
MIICLRPQPDCDADVAELTRRAVQSVALPMLQVAYLSDPPVLFSSADESGDYQGIIITSKHASRYLAAQPDASSELRCLPVWCVGNGSANILRKAGFAIAYAGKGNAADLADQVCQQGAAGPFLWLSGRDVYLDMTACLKAQGIMVKRQVVYHADALLAPYQVVQDHLLSEQPAAVIVFSTRTLEQFYLWLAKYVPTAKPVQLTVLAASADLAEQARAAGYPAFEAESPDRQAVLQLSVDWFQQKFIKKAHKN